MMANDITPCSALFSAMKKQGGISYKELAGLILSGKPLSDGRSPVSRINDRTWVSRFIVHAPVGSLQDRYFCDFSVSALRIIARLKARTGKALSSIIAQGESSSRRTFLSLSMRALCSACEPWEKLHRATSIPACRRFLSADSESTAGPSVQIIFVRFAISTVRLSVGANFGYWRK